MLIMNSSFTEKLYAVVLQDIKKSKQISNVLLHIILQYAMHMFHTGHIYKPLEPSTGML